MKLLYHMHQTVVSNLYCRNLLDSAATESVILWREPVSGINCKCKLDIRQEALVADIKTTSARSLKAFLNCCHHY